MFLYFYFTIFKNFKQKKEGKNLKFPFTIFFTMIIPIIIVFKNITRKSKSTKNPLEKRVLKIQNYFTKQIIFFLPRQLIKFLLGFFEVFYEGWIKIKISRGCDDGKFYTLYVFTKSVILCLFSFSCFALK